MRHSVTRSILCGSKYISDYNLVKSETGETMLSPLALTPPTTSPSTSRSSSGFDGDQFSNRKKTPSKEIPFDLHGDEQKDTSAISEFFANVYSPALLSKAGKVVVFFLYMAYLVRISFGITQLNIGFRAQNLFPKESTSYYWYVFLVL